MIINKKNTSKSAASVQVSASKAMPFISALIFTDKKQNTNNQHIHSRAKSMKRYPIKSLGFLLCTLLAGVNAYAGSSVNWGSFPADGSTVNSGQDFGTLSALADYTGWDCSQESSMSASGGCWFNDGATASPISDTTTCGDSSVSANVKMKAGTLQACTVRLYADMAGSGATDQTRTVYVRQIITLVNPGSKDDVDPDYTITASGKTADGVANTISPSNKLSFVSTTTSVCTIASTDINTAVVHHVPGASGTCTVTAYATGDSNIKPANSGAVSWSVVNTQYPKLALVSPMTKGLTPSFVFSSSQPSGPGTYITIGGSCGAAPLNQAAVAGNNTFTLKTLVLGTTYSDCYVRVRNNVGLDGDLALPPFTVTENVQGPGGVGNTDGSAGSTMELWLNGNNLPVSGSIPTWNDQSGKGRNFSGGVSPTVGALNGFSTAQFLNASNTHLNYAGALQPRSLFTVYNDTSTASYVTFLANDGYWWHGAAADTSLFLSGTAHANVIGGANAINGTTYTGTVGPARPDAYSINSFVMATAVPTTGNANWRLGADRDCCASRSINGGIAEVIMYSNAINNAQRTIIENYLSAKYNIALAVGQVYTYGGAAAYKYDMAGIGQHTDSSLHLRAKGSAVEMANPTGLAVNEYVMWAHDNAAMTFQNTDVPSSLNIVHRLTRKWKVRNTGVSTMDISFHVSELPGFLSMCFNAGNIRLLLDADGTFAAGASSYTGAYDSKTQMVTFTNVVVADGSLMTFGVGGSPTSVYVTPKGKGNLDGSDWNNSCTLDAALRSPRITGDIVKLSRGLYKPASTISLTAGITIIGGFEGVLTSEVSSPETFETVVSGDLDNNDEALGNIVMYHRDIQGTNLDRLFNISNVPNPVTLEGFYITGMSQSGSHGSVVWQQSSVVNYNKMKIFGNRARELGGALLVYNSSTANITDSIFLGNVGGYGGAINGHVSSTINITNSQFTNNQAWFLVDRYPAAKRFSGGAIDLNSSSSAVITNSTFIGNNAQNLDNSLAIQGLGGAISLSQNSNAADETLNNASLTITGSTFSYNEARDGGGAIYAMPGFNTITINSSQFTSNAATRPASTSFWGSGGAISARGSAISTAGKNVININDTEFEKNSARELGGALFLSSSADYPATPLDSYLVVNIKRSAFIDNTATYGGAYWSWNYAAANGASQPVNNLSTVENTTFTGNATTNHSGAICAAYGAQLTLKHATIYNNVGNATTGGIGLYSPAKLTLSNSMIFGNQGPTATGKNIYTIGTGAGAVVTTATGYNLIGFNDGNTSGWYDAQAAAVKPANTLANSFTSTATLATNIINTTLAKNGGLTRNFSLSSNGGSGSSAYNLIPVASCSTTDQRSVNRNTGTKCDIGSYEAIKTDTDSDGFVDALDNCPTISNASQSNIDSASDSLGDVCDTDMDGDGVANTSDQFPTISLGGRLDSDSDGIPDSCDAACTTAGMYADADVDNDTVPNTSDNCPTTPNATQNNVDNDSFGDACDTDMDGDGVNNVSDNCPSVSNPLQTDSDGNGLGDDCNALFVKPVASGLANCSSWNNACAGGTGTQLQAVIDSAFANKATLIYMAKGLYRPSATVNLKKGLQFYGGFTGVDELYHYQANPDQNMTIITGDIDSNDTVDVNGITQSYTNQAGANLAQILNADTLGVNADAVVAMTGITVTGAGSNAALHVKNSRLRINNLKFLGNKGTNGAALFMEAVSYAVVSDSKFAGNQSTDTTVPFEGGGAIFVSGAGSELTLANCELSANRSTTFGGAISVLTNAKATLRTCIVFDNQSVDSGGAIHANAVDSLYVVGSTFSGNRTATTAVDTGGGAIRVSGAFTNAYIGSSDFIDNTSAREGGALMVSSTGDITVPKVVTVEDTLFKSNETIGASAYAGGAISVGSNIGTTNVTISRSSFISNASLRGGALEFAGGNGNQLALDNSTFYDNSSLSGGYGGAIGLDGQADAVINHVTVLQNRAVGDAGGIRVAVAGSALTLKNSLVIANTSTASSGGANVSIASGTYTDGGYNLIGYGASSGLYTGGAANATPVTPSKKAAATDIASIITPALTDYSGLHKTIALTATSEARDAIPNGTNGCVTGAGYDERGFDRPDMIDVTDPDQKNDVRKCDIGSFEFNNAYRVDCFAEDGLRPDQGTGYGYYYCEDGTTPSAGELANNVFVGRVDYYLLAFMCMMGLVRLQRKQARNP